MPLNSNEIVDVLAELAQVNNLRVTVNQSLLWGMVAGLGATSGALFLGPIGIAAGGIAGSIFAAIKANGKFRPVYVVLKEDLTSTQKARLALSCTNIINDLHVSDFACVMALAMSTPSLQERLLKVLMSFLSSEMYKVVQ